MMFCYPTLPLVFRHFLNQGIQANNPVMIASVHQARARDLQAIFPNNDIDDVARILQLLTTVGTTLIIPQDIAMGLVVRIITALNNMLH